MIIEYLVSFGAWNWLIAAAAFFIIELLAPGAFMLWLGLSALLVGIISRFVIWPWQYQLVAFAVFALASIPLWRQFALEKPIVAGSGTVKIDDTIWRLSGPDSPAGSRVKVVRADAATLVVEK